MKKIILLSFSSILFFNSCDTTIKSNKKVIIEEGTNLSGNTSEVQIEETDFISDSVLPEEISIDTTPLIIKDTLIGSWVGYFKKDNKDYQKDIYVDEGFHWGIIVALKKIV